MKGRKKSRRLKTSRGKKQRKTLETSEDGFNPFLLVKDEMWLTIMDPLLGENPEAAESLARLFQVFKEAIERGPEGVTGVYWALVDGICRAYEYTEAHQKGLRLYNLYLAGKLRKQDTPLNLINAAIARAVPEKG